MPIMRKPKPDDAPAKPRGSGRSLHQLDPAMARRVALYPGCGPCPTRLRVARQLERTHTQVVPTRSDTEGRAAGHCDARPVAVPAATKALNPDLAAGQHRQTHRLGYRPA